jgi:DNA-binding transcriptional LysR family regulator
MTNPALDLDCVRAFLAIADLRSFTRAALSLHRTQSAVSMQMKRLEGQLGVALLRRSKAGVDLTLAGERFLGDARRLVALNDDAVGRLVEHNLEGHVRLGAMEDYGTSLIPPLLASFVAAYPNIRVEMETGLTYAMPDRLDDAYDIVIAMHPEGACEGEFLRYEQAVWAGSPSHAIEEREPLPVALHPPGCLFRKWAMERLDAAKRRWRLAFVTHSLAAAESIAAQGLAVTVAKAGTFPARLRALGERDGVPSLPAAEIRLHRASRLSRAGALLADHLAAGLTRPLPRADTAP